MAQKSDRKELERRLEQARRMAKDPSDPLTNERLAKLIHDLEEQLAANRGCSSERLELPHTQSGSCDNTEGAASGAQAS